MNENRKIKEKSEDSGAPEQVENELQKEEPTFTPNEVLEPLGFIDQQLTDDQNYLLAFFQLPLYEKPRKIDLNASVTAGFDEKGSYLLVFDFEVTVFIDVCDVHIGSYDIVLNYENRNKFAIIFKAIVTFLSQSAKLYVATQALLDEKKEKPN